jgi:hypothetical protein
VDTVHFLGRIWPSSHSISIGYDPTIEHEESDKNFKATFVVRIKDSAIDIECSLPHFDAGILGMLFIRAYDKARVAVNLVSFASGLGLGLVLDRIVLPDGKETPLAFEHPHLSALCSAFQLGTSSKTFDGMYRLVHGDFQLWMALDDLTAMLIFPNLVEINCGRVLDGLRRMMAPNVANVGTAWGILQTQLNVSRAYREFITGHSADPRHANRAAQGGPHAREISIRTWTLFNRFLEYRARGNQPLGSPQFPLL